MGQLNAPGLLPKVKEKTELFTFCLKFYPALNCLSSFCLHSVSECLSKYSVVRLSKGTCMNCIVLPGVKILACLPLEKRFTIRETLKRKES